MKDKRILKVRVTVILFYPKLAPTDPGCNMLQALLGWKKILGRNVR